MIEEVSVVYLVQAAFGQQKTHMLLQFFTVHECLYQAFHDPFLLLCQPVWIRRVHGGEMTVRHLVLLPIQTDGAFLKINQMEKIPGLQFKFRMLLDELSLHLKLDNGDGFVHLHIQVRLAGTAGVGPLKHKTGAGIISIDVQGKGGQRKQVDAISVFQDIQVSVPCTDADRICNASPLPHRGSHPEHIMVPPLNVQGMIGHKLIHDDMGSRPPVIYISQYVQMVYNEALDQFTQGHDKFPGPAHPYDGPHNGAVVGFLIPHIHLFRDQLLDHIGKFWRQGLSHFRSGVFARRPLAHLNEAVQGYLIPILPVMYLIQDLRHLLPGIIDQGGQFLLILAAQRVSEHVIYLAPHSSRPIF